MRKKIFNCLQLEPFYGLKAVYVWLLIYKSDGFFLSTYYKTCDFINLFADRLVNSVVFPVEKAIPENIKEQLIVELYSK